MRSFVALVLVAVALCTVIGNVSAAVKAVNGTVFYINQKFVLAPGIDKQGVAWGSFIDQIELTGWGHLHLESNPNFDDKLQMYAAGYLEGALTASRIYQQYINIYSSFWGDSPLPGDLETWLVTQDRWVRDMADKYSKTDGYWAQVSFVLAQFDGLKKGYEDNCISTQDLDSLAFMILNGVGDLLDLTTAFANNTLRPRSVHDHGTYNDLKKYVYSSHCSSLIKVTGDLKDIFAGHSSWYVYGAMLRISKYYTFPLKHSDTKAKAVTFSSYPGFLESLDDFYITDQKLIVIETSISNFNDTLWQYVRDHPQSVLSWQRTLVANRMSNSGKEWSENYSKYQSGTYNNQWIVVDLKHFTPGQAIKPGTLTILEQEPTYIEYADQSQILAAGYWPSYNVPFYKRLYEDMGYVQMAQQQPVMLSYETCCRANIFRRDQGKVDDLDSYKHLMRYNDYKNDPYSFGNPGYSVSSRFDLEPESQQPGPFGGIDNKATHWELASKMEWHGLNGPTNQDQPTFVWTERDNIFSNTSHLGQPQKFNFGYVHMSPKKF